MRTHRKSFRITAAKVLLFAFLLIFSAFFFRLRRAEAQILETSAKSWGTLLLAKSAGAGMRETPQLLYAEKSADGKIQMLSVDAAALHSLTENTVLAAEEMVRSEKLSAQVPVLDLLAGELFSGAGPQISFRFSPAGAVSASSRSETVSSGLNQTAYRVILELQMEVTAVTSFYARTVLVSYEVVAAETLVMGEVPFGKME